MKKCILALLFLLFFSQAFSQCCIIDVPTSDGYTVHIEVFLDSVQVKNVQPTGYNYDIYFNYDVSFIGGTPAIWTLQGVIGCDDGTAFFDLPNGAGAGNTVSAGNVWRPQNDQASATVSSLGCTDITIQIHGSGIPNQYISCTALPVEFLTINATVQDDGSGVLITWATAMEENNDYFVVERSVDGVFFETVGYVNGAGNSSEILVYNLLDTNPEKLYSYYRVKQVDYDRAHDYSSVVSVYIGNALDVYIHPNHVENTLYIETVSEKIIIVMHDMLGKTVNTYDNVREIDVSFLIPGVYVLEIFDGTTKVIEKIVKK